MNIKPILVIMLLLISLTPIALAVSAPTNSALSSSDRAKFDEILKPVMMIYNFIKYIASVVAVIFLAYSGIAYMTSGSDSKKRDQAKNIAGYVIIGLIIIWAAPLIVGLLV